jgi:predicted DNA-binding transcriptional regulator
MSNIQSQIQILARSFVDQVVEILRGASLRDLVSHEGGAGSALPNGRPTRTTSAPAVSAPSATAPRAARSTGRLPRRSAGEIEAALDKIVALLRKHKEGLRAEEIRSNLGMMAKEMPRILKEGLSTKKLTSKGQKRATTYFAK